MGGLLLVLVVIAAIFYGFAAIFRRRVRTNLERAGVELPPELGAFKAGVTGVARAPASTVAVPSARAAAPVAPTPAGLHFMLIYDVGPGFLERRAQYRDEHLALAWKAADGGSLVLAGALEEPTEQAFLLFRGSREAASRFAQADPYVRHGLVRSWKVKQWHTVAGATAAIPLRPKG